MTTIANEAGLLAKKIRLWEDSISERVVERRRETRGLVVAAIAGAHHLQIGPPGTAKSFLVTTSMSLVRDAKFMEVLLHGYSVMEDMYGPISLKALDDDRYLRKTDTYLPWADFAFCDEVFRANPTLLNTNLWSFNERKFRNDGQVTQIPLISGFFAANDGPDDPTLQAFDDRIHLRYQVGPLKEASSRAAMFRMRLARATQPKPEPVIAIEDIRRANELVAQVEVPDTVLDALNDLYDELVKVAITPTDRKMGDSLTLIQASALREGRMVACVDDMTILGDVFWSNPKDRPIVAEKVMETARPIDREAQDIANNIEKLAAEVEEIIGIDQKTLRIKRSVQVHTKVESANAEINELRQKAIAQGTTSEIAEEAKRRIHSVAKRLLIKGFRIPTTDGQLDTASLAAIIAEMREEEAANG